MRAYYLKNQERLKIKQRDYRLANLEEDKKRKKKYGEDNRGYLAIWQREYVARRRLELFGLLGGVCRDCSNDDVRVLLIHHKKIMTKTHRRDWMKKDYDISKLELLCANCHALEHAQDYKNIKKIYG